jgi:hypothetical protein
MIQSLYTLHQIDNDKLQDVCKQMRILGAPTIRVVDCGDHYVALEGTHRLAACAALGIAPTLEVLAQDDLVEADSLDWQDLQSGESYSAGELAGEVYSYSNGCYRITDDGTLQPH